MDISQRILVEIITARIDNSAHLNFLLSQGPSDS